MPLTRAGDGSLGVRAVGGGQNAGASEGPKVYITIEGGNTSTQAPSGFEQFGQQIGSFVEKIQGADGAGYAPRRDGLECS